MPISTAPFLMNGVSLTLSLAGGTPVEYKCQLNQAQLTPGTGGGGGGSTYETFCATFDSGGAGNSTWTLDLGGFQAFADVEDLSLFLFDNEGALLDFVLTPLGGTVSATNPAFSGQVTAAPTAIGGTANQYATYTISLPVQGKPVKEIGP